MHNERDHRPRGPTRVAIEKPETSIEANDVDTPKTQPASQDRLTMRKAALRVH